MHCLINLNQKNKWQELIDLIPEADVYYTPEYCEVCQKNGEGEANLFVFREGKSYVIYPYLKRRISDIPLFAGIDLNGYYDIITPYGYGGPLASTEENRQAMVKRFCSSFKEYCRKNGIVTEFVRFHPLLNNYSYCTRIMNIVYTRNTVFIDLSKDGKQLWEGLTRENRNRIKKAHRLGVTVREGGNDKDWHNFMSLYKQTMDRRGASTYYYFSADYFNNLRQILKDDIRLFLAEKDGQVLAAALFMIKDIYLHYHLGGSDKAFLNMAPNNLLFFEVILWGKNIGCRYMHLGGGYLGNSDSLHRFKKSFNSNGETPFYTGKEVHLPEVYEYLNHLWRKRYGDSNTEESDFFPLYRR